MAVTAVPEQSGKALGQPMERDPRWLLAQRIVASPGFARSPRLVAFLLFVAERTLAGQASEINEQSIGVRVFGRTSGYDSNDDNIVRSHATRLRQKLEQYFQTEGSEEPLRVAIPKGSYVPSFYDAPAMDAPVLDAPQDESAGVALERAVLPLPPQDEEIVPRHKNSTEDHGMRRSTWRNRLTTAILCGVCVLVTFFCTSYRDHKLPLSTPEPNHALWQELLDGKRNTLIVNGDSSLVLWENMSGKMLTLGEYLSGNYRDQVAPQDKTDPHTMRTIARRRLTSIVDLAIANRITGRPELAPGHAALRYARDLHVDDLKGSNVILIGSEEANPWVQLYADSLNFTLVPDQQTKVFTIRNRSPKPGEAATYQSVPGDPDRRAYALVAFLKNLDGSGRTLIIQGTAMAGTEAAADYVLGQNELSTLLRSASSSGGTLPDFEVLLETANLNGNAPKSKLLAIRIAGK
jgi:hypothetical protein